MASLLTSQLEQSSLPNGEKTTAPIELLYNPAFPCLRHARGDVVGMVGNVPVVKQSDEEVEIPDARSMSFAGTSAPIGSVPEDKVDYELNPIKRRGGEEIISSDFLGGASPARLSSSVNLKQSLIGGEVIGSLPKALTLEERRSVRESIPMSPSMSLLGSLGKEKVDVPSLYAQKLRRTVLRGAIVLFITAGYSGKRFIFERCKQLGVRAVIIDGPDSWSQQLVKDGLAEDFIGVDFEDADTLFDRLLSVCRQVRSKYGELDGVITFCELAVPLVSRLAEHLGLPGNSPEAVDTARNKHAARACMERCGLPTPRNFLIKSTDDLTTASEAVGYPAVIKPVSGAASIGVIRVNDFEQLKASYSRVIRDLKGARVVAGALQEGAADDDASGNAGSWMDLSIMMEEYLDGDEVDVDLVLSGGQPVYGGVTDNWPTVEPYFNETGSNCPSLLSRAKQMELVDLAVKSVQSMDLQTGVFHVELKFTSRGARLIEVNARMGGGPVRDTNLLVWGVDLVEQQLLASCGIPCRPALAQAPRNELAEVTLNASVTGTLENLKFLEEWQGMDGVLYARPLVQAGAACICVDDGLPTWIGEIMVNKSPVADAVSWIKDIEAAITPMIPITPLQK